MADSKSSLAWQTPLKDLHLARVMFRDLRAKIIAWQKEEYDTETLAFLTDRQENGLPFALNFSGDPDAIKQIKNFTNALYLAEQAFDKSGDINIATAKYNPKLIGESYDACHLLLELSEDIENNFQQEIACFASNLLSLLKTINKPSLSNLPLTTEELGHTFGKAIEQMKPSENKTGFDLLTYFGAVFPTFPTHLENLDVAFKKLRTRNPEHVANYDDKKMKQLLEQGVKLNDTIASSNKNTLYFVFNLVSLIHQTRILWSEIYQEAGDLNETLQALGREQLALFKYDLLPALFKGVDKLELQLMLKPGRLSEPLMEQIKPWHEALVQTLKPYIKFDKTNEQLLKIEDARFIELRIAPLQQAIETSAQALHLIEPALTSLEQFRDAYNEIASNTKQDTKNNQVLLEAYAKHNAALKEQIIYIKPYMSNTDIKFLQHLEKHLDAEANWGDYLYDQASNWYYYLTGSQKKTTNNPTPENRKQTFTQLAQRWEQLKINHAFTLERHEAQIKSVQEKAHRVVFPYNPNSHHQDPIDVSANASWALYRAHEQKLTQLKQAQKDCIHLEETLNAHPQWFNAKSISFHPHYTPALLTSNIVHQPQHIYFKIEGSVLKYEVLEPLKNKLLTLYLMPLDEAIKAKHRGYVWNHDQNQLSYIAENGHIQPNISLSNTVFLKMFIKGHQSRLGKNNELQLTEKMLHRCITLRSQKIHQGSIPLTELGCSLTQLTMPEQLTPYLSHVFNEALERGHIHDELKENCIKWYSSIQPYLIPAFKDNTNMDIEQFDEQVAHVFSGDFNRNSSNAEPNILPSNFNNKLIALKFELEEQIRDEKKERDVHFNKIKNKPFTFKIELDNQLKHREFSLDTAQFMQSLIPIKRQIHASKNTLFQINLALTHLEKYKRKDNPDTSLNADDYAWFQAYTNQLLSMTVSKMHARLLEIKAYEEQQIKRNKNILEALNTNATLSEKTDKTLLHKKHAFMYFGHTYEPVPMPEDAAPKPGELQLNIEDKQLHYQFLHYGQPLDGKISIDEIKPTLTEFNQDTIVSNETLSDILNTAYIDRNHQIDSNTVKPSPEEALDLYQWYRVEYDNLSDHTTAHAERLKQKIDRYESLAKEKPELNLIKQDNASPEDRMHYLLKHKKTSKQLRELKSSLYKHFENLNTPLKQELNTNIDSVALPYPEVGAQNYLINIIKKGVKIKDPIMLLETLRLYSVTQVPDETDILKNPHQVLLLKRLMNILYYLEQVALELEQVNEIDGEIPYVTHLAISYLYLQDITPLLEALYRDPVFPRFYAEVARKVENIFNVLSHESKHYIEASKPENSSKYINSTFITLFNTLKMLPERLSSSTAKFKEKRQNLKNEVQISVNTIEKILEHYNSSWSYILLLMDLPVIQYLLKDMGEDLEKLLKNTHNITVNNLTKIKTDYLAKLILEADALERKLGLAPGLISKPLQAILDEFYKGFITPLVPEVDAQIELLCEDGLITQRLEVAQQHKIDAKETIIQYKNAAKEVEILLSACEEKIEQTSHLLWMKKYDPRKLSSKSLEHLKVDYVRYEDKIFFITPNHELLLLPEKERDLIIFAMKKANKGNNYTFKPLKIALKATYSLQQTAYEELNTIYQETLPVLKASLNSSDVYLMPFQEAQKQGLRDCFVWHEKTSQLYHLDTSGEPNPQSGCKLFLTSIPAGKEKPNPLVQETTRLFPFNVKSPKPASKLRISINTKHPTLVKHGDKYYLYHNANDSTLTYRHQEHSGWEYTELDAEVIANMGLDFSRTKLLETDKKYQDMYTEIAAKTSLVYPIQLINKFKTLRFITQKKEKDDIKLYLSEHAISEYITSNSDFSLPQDGVSITPGCCLITLKIIPTDFYELELPSGYGSYYAQIQGKTDVLYYIDVETRSIEALPIPENKQDDAIIILNDTKKHRIFDTKDFENITALTKHTSDASIMVDVNNFKPDTRSIHKLHTLVKACKAYYKGMSATSKFGWKAVNEQVVSLVRIKEAQEEKHHQIKNAVYSNYLTQHVHTFVQEEIKLHGYKLCPLEKHTTLKPDCLYIKKIQDDAFEYRVINPAGKHRGTRVSMKEIVGWPKGKPLKSIDELRAHLPEILRVTSKRGDGHTCSYTLINEYHEKLTHALLSENEALVEQAIGSGESKTIDDALAFKRSEFNQQHFKHYQQLDAINRTVHDFRHYLKHAESQLTKTYSCFEKEDTIKRKRESLDIIDKFSSDASKSPQNRVKDIQVYLKKSYVLDKFMSYHTYESTCLESLLQCVFSLLEAAGLYTPTMVERLDKLVDEVVKNDDTAPPKADNAFRFFAKTTREKIKEKVHGPKPDNPEH